MRENPTEIQVPRFLSFVNVGEDPPHPKPGWIGRRQWNACVEYGFLSAGQHPKYSIQLERLQAGDIIAAYITGEGYVGIGKILKASIPIKNFLFDGKMIKGMNYVKKTLFDNEDNEKSEYVRICY